MKKFISVFIVLIISTVIIYAQAPKAFNYSGIAQDTKGNPIRNKNISVKVDILDGAADGPSIYSETHDVKTNVIGFFSIKVGGEGLPDGSLEGIDWGASHKWLAITIEYNGGHKHNGPPIRQFMGAVQLISVPYALHAKSAESITSDGDYFVNGGETGNADRSLGNTDSYALGLMTDSQTRLNITSEGNIGIGTSVPNGRFEVAKDQAVSTITATTYRPSFFTAGKFIGRGARGTQEEPLPVQENDWLATYNANGYGLTGFSSFSRARIGMLAAENWTDEDQGTYMIFETTPAGSTDVTERMKITDEGNVGIGTSDPDGRFELAADQVVSGITTTTYKTSSYNAGVFNARGARGTQEDPLPLQEHDWLASYNGNGYGSTGFSYYSRARIGMRAAENWTDEDQGTYMIFATTPVGSTDVTERMKITDEGKVGIGTTDPSHNLEVVADQRTVAITATTYRESGFTGSQFLARAARGTQDDPLPLRENDYLASFNGRGFGTTEFSNFPRVRIGMRTSEDWTDDRQGALMTFWTTATGSTDFTEKMRITPEGDAGIGITDPQSKLHIDGGIQLASDFDPPSPEKAGTLRYRADSNNSYVEMCMQVGPFSYAWVIIKQNSW